MLASGHPDGRKPVNTLQPQTNSKLAKNNSPFTPWERGARQLPASVQPGPGHLGQECSASNVTHTQGGESQQCQNASCCPFSPWARGKVPCSSGVTGSRTLCGRRHFALAASTTLLFPQSHLCAGDSSPPGSFASCMSSCCKPAAGHRDSPQPQRRPTSQRLTVSLGCTWCWNKLKASWECLRKPGIVPALPCALWFPRVSSASRRDRSAALPAVTCLLLPSASLPAQLLACPRAPPAGPSSSLQVLPRLALPARTCPAILLASALLPGTALRLPVRGPACSKGSLFPSAAPTPPVFTGFPSLGLSLFPLPLCCLFSPVSLPTILPPGCSDVFSQSGLKLIPPPPLPGCLPCCPFPLLTVLLTPWDYFSFSPCLVAFGS